MSEYLTIVEHYEQCLARYGDSHLGVDWPNPEDAAKRYRVMLEVIKPSSGVMSLLDFGCGASHLFQYLVDHKIQGLQYTGLDASKAFCELSARKFPTNRYLCLDVLAEPDALEAYDYVIMNGVFTEKRTLSFDAMNEYFRKMLKIVFAKTRYGIAFNVMSKQVDWERDDLFHVPIGDLTDFLAQSMSRHYVVRNDYGLYEYTVYVYKGTS